MKKPLQKFPIILPLYVLFGMLIYSCSMVPDSLTSASNGSKIVAYLADSLGIDSCITGTALSLTDLPDTAEAYLASNYAQDTVAGIYQYSVAMDTAYLVSLMSGTQILFGAQGQVLLAGNPSELDDDDAEYFVKDFLKQVYPGLKVHHFDDIVIMPDTLGGYVVSVEFKHDDELVFDISAGSICYEYFEGQGKKKKKKKGYDDDDDDKQGHKNGCIAKDSLPASVDSVLSTNYAQYTIDDISCDSLCDGTRGYWLELNGHNGVKPEEVYLFFDTTGVFLIESVEIDDDDVPSAVFSGFEAQYPKADDIDDAWTWTLADGTKQYLIEGEEKHDDEVYALFADDGTFLCELPWDDDHHGHHD